MVLWKEYLLGFETRHWASPSWDIVRQGGGSGEDETYRENFRFAQGPAAFVSINLGNGDVNIFSELQPRLEANLVWIDAAYNFYRDSPIVSTIFILADDGPPGSLSNKSFFQDLLGRIGSNYTDIDFVYVHRGASEWGQTEAYQGIKNLDVIEVLGPIWPPLRMTVSFEADKRIIKLDDSW
jgi:hypothetical protein